MKFLFWKIEAKREPRYPSYEEYKALSALVADLSEGITDINKRIEAYDRRYYRAHEREEAEKVLAKPQLRLEAGMSLTNEQALEILRGDGQ